MNTSIRTAIAALILSAPLASQAAIVQFTASLSGDQEFPDPNGSTALGTASGTLDTLTNIFSWNVTVDAAHPLTGGPALAGHFHGNTDSPPNHTNDARGVVMGFLGADAPSFSFDNLTGLTSGSFFGAVDLDLVPTALANIAGLLSSQWYVNIHNAEFPGGEIRGQFVTATLVPSPIPVPAAVWLLGSALIGATSIRRRVIL